MEKFVTVSKQGQRFTLIKSKTSGETLVGEMKKKDGLNLTWTNKSLQIIQRKKTLG